MYRILGTDGKEYGPINADVLRQWIAQKRAVATTSVQADGTSDWKPLSAFPEFADALAGSKASLVSGGAIPVTPPVSGPVRTSKLAIASLVSGVLGFLCLPALAGLVLGVSALVKISKSKGQLRGQALAICGICLSALMLIVIVPAALLLPALAQAKAKAQRINCISNLKQIGLAARIYSNDNKEIFPPDFLSMSNELNTPKILVCAADTKHTKVSTWAEFDPRKNLTYEYLKPGIAESNAMNEVIFRCPIHNNVGIGDGSVQTLGRK
jgi:hypothetical protein